MSRIQYYKERIKDKTISTEEALKANDILDELVRQRMEILEDVQKLERLGYKGDLLKYDDVLEMLKEK